MGGVAHFVVRAILDIAHFTALLIEYETEHVGARGWIVCLRGASPFYVSA